MSQANPIDPDLRVVLKKLSLGRVLDTLPERLVLGRKSKMTFEEMLLLVLRDEVDRRENNAARQRVLRARLEPDMVIERWDETSNVTFDKRVLDELLSLRFVRDRRNAILLGPVGVGKTFLATAIGHVACRNGFHVHFTRADDMLQRLRQSRLDNSRDVVLAELISTDILILDDFPLEKMTRDESRDVYQLFIERSGRLSTIITSNRDTSEWLEAFHDVLLAQGIVDRIVNSAYDLIMEGETYRGRLKPTLPLRLDPSEPPVVKSALPPKRRRKL